MHASPHVEVPEPDDSPQRLQRLRRIARKKGYRLVKSREVRWPYRPLYWIADSARDWIVAGRPYGWNLDEVEEWLQGDIEAWLSDLI